MVEPPVFACFGLPRYSNLCEHACKEFKKGSHCAKSWPICWPDDSMLFTISVTGFEAGKIELRLARHQGLKLNRPLLQALHDTTVQLWWVSFGPCSTPRAVLVLQAAPWGSALQRQLRCGKLEWAPSSSRSLPSLISPFGSGSFGPFQKEGGRKKNVGSCDARQNLNHPYEKYSQPTNHLLVYNWEKCVKPRATNGEMAILMPSWY